MKITNEQANELISELDEYARFYSGNHGLPRGDVHIQEMRNLIKSILRK